jgi:glycosyltransferase involved in cell wall biosynthesis
MDKKHILVYGASRQRLGGIETYLFTMDKFGSDDVIWDYIIEAMPNVPTIHKNQIEELGGEIHFIHPKSRTIRTFMDWVKLLKAQKNYDDTVYFNLYYLSWFVPVILAKLYGYRIILHAHNNQIQGGVLKKAVHAFNRMLQKPMNVIRLTNSELSAKLFFGNKNAELIYNAIDTKRFSYNENIRMELREKLKVRDKNLYGFSGRMAPPKNPFFLMDVFAEISKIDTNAAFLVCGSGEMMDEVQTKASALGIHVIFTGTVTNIEDYYQAMDCYILPSVFEGLGIVLIEAQCSGLPCVASAEVIPEIVKVTDLMNFVNLDMGAEKWAKICVESINVKKNARSDYATVVKNTRFNAETEAKVLEDILCAN